MNATFLTAYDSAAYDRVLNEIYQALHQQKILIFADRVHWISAFFLGKPYLANALGEGPAGVFDQNPLYRTDAFDCVTFVNTVLALAMGTDIPTFRHYLLRLNYYDSLPQYEKRYHFMSVDWNVQNAKWGVVTDMTPRMKNDQGAPIYKIATAMIDRPNWFRHRASADIKLIRPIAAEKVIALVRQLQQKAVTVCVEKNELPYLPLSVLLPQGQVNEKLFAQIPQGAIVEIVRPAWDLRDKIGTHLQISHLGFVFWIENQLIFRHAASTKGVMDVPLTTYLQQVCLPIETIKGIHVLSTQKP
jgi:hypothetical protein